MAIPAEEVFAATMTPEMIAASDRRAAELGQEWKAARAELPAEVRDRLDVVRQKRIGSAR
ncbi:hypothetical protein [Rhizobium sp. BK176]|uniref:hypothetical protein n=1 Tax=Rhizobium sp. BK176 TaxID=2587071 RepID=UPI00216A5636|nr:hypothetical protein [Rhizobium sp. BK176]